MECTKSIQTLTTWAEATAAWDKQACRDSLNCLLQIEKPNSKILFNIGCAHLQLGNNHKAEQSFTSAISKDEHMAIAYFQRGCVLVKSKRVQDAHGDFEECQKRFRAQSVIDYSQLGLKYKLYKCEAKHNSGVVKAMDGDRTAALQILENAFKLKVERRHQIIGDSLQNLKNGQTPTLIKIPHEAIYRPPKGKVANLDKKDFLGKAKVISAIDHDDDFSGFVGPKKLEEQRRLSPPVSPGSSPPARRHLSPGQAARRSPSPVLPSKEQLSAASRNFSPKLKRMNVNGANSIHPGSQDDTVLKVPQRGAPLLPPRTNGTRRVSEGVIRVGVSARLPPPPSRPPPKLDRKPLPQLPTYESENSRPQVKEVVQVELRCNTAKVITVKPRTPLAGLVATACKEFGLEDNSINLWWRRTEDNEQEPILTEEGMQKIWEIYVHRGLLILWCYAKQ